MPRTNPITESNLPAFPETAWLGVTGDYYDLVAPTTEAPDEFIWGSSIGTLSALASDCITLPFGTGVMKPGLFCCLLGNTARTRKTTSIIDAVDVILEPLRPRSTQPGEPDPMEVVRGQGSGEGLLDALADRSWWPTGVSKATTPPTVQTGRSAIFLFDEFGAVLEKMARDQAGNLHSFLLQLFDAPAQITHATRTNRTVCTNARGIILAASTPDYLARNLSEGMVRSGLVNRFLFLAGQRTSPIPIRPAIDPRAHAALLARIRSHMNALRGQAMTLSPEAIAVNAERYVAHFDRAEESALIEAATDRAPMLALRLAMVLAFADGSAVITGAHMTGAWDVVLYSGAVVARLLGLMKSRDFEEAERKLLRAARRQADQSGGTFARSEVRARLHGGNGLTAKAYTAVWEASVAAEDIMPVPASASTQGPEPRYIVNPSLMEERS